MNNQLLAFKCSMLNLQHLYLSLCVSIYILCTSVWYSIHFVKLMVLLVIFPFVAVVLLMSTNMMNVFSPFSYFSKYTHNTQISMKTYLESDLIMTNERHLQKINFFKQGANICEEKSFDLASYQRFTY